MKKLMEAFTGQTALPAPPFWRAAVRAGLMAAFVMALAAHGDTVRSVSKCQGEFSRKDFSNAFDEYHCDLVVRKVGSNFQIEIPLP